MPESTGGMRVAMADEVDVMVGRVGVDEGVAEEQAEDKSWNHFY